MATDVELIWHVDGTANTGATLTAATGATLAELMARLGHSTVSAAMRYQPAAQRLRHINAAVR